MFLDYLYTLPNSTEGMDTILKETITVVPFLTPMILFFIFTVVFLGGISRQKLRTGQPDYPSWAIIASMATLLPALILSVNDGFIELTWLLVIVSLNLLSAVWFFLDRKVSEI